jgi:hypothetical protein
VGQIKAGKNFFFEKKKQKTSANWRMGRHTCHNRQEQKFFGSFFSKKNFLLPLSVFFTLRPNFEILR